MSRSLLVEVQAKLFKLKIVADQLLLLLVQLPQLVLIGLHLRAHNARRVLAEAIPFARELSSLLPVVVEETAEIAKFLIVVDQTSISFFQGTQFSDQRLWRFER